MMCASQAQCPRLYFNLGFPSHSYNSSSSVQIRSHMLELAPHNLLVDDLNVTPTIPLLPTPLPHCVTMHVLEANGLTIGIQHLGEGVLDTVPLSGLLHYYLLQRVEASKQALEVVVMPPRPRLQIRNLPMLSRGREFIVPGIVPIFILIEQPKSADSQVFAFDAYAGYGALEIVSIVDEELEQIVRVQVTHIHIVCNVTRPRPFIELLQIILTIIDIRDVEGAVAVCQGIRLGVELATGEGEIQCRDDVRCEGLIEEPVVTGAALDQPVAEGILVDEVANLAWQT